MSTTSRGRNPVSAGRRATPSRVPTERGARVLISMARCRRDAAKAKVARNDDVPTHGRDSATRTHTLERARLVHRTHSLHYGTADVLVACLSGRSGRVPVGGHRLAGWQQFLRPNQTGRVRRRRTGRRRPCHLLRRGRGHRFSAAAATVVAGVAGKFIYHI